MYYFEARKQCPIAQQQYIGEQKVTTRLNDLFKQLRQNQRETDKILSETKDELLRSTHTSEHWQQQYQALNARAEQDEKVAKDTQAQLSAVIQKLAITEEALREVAAQNRILIKDKWILEQERTAS